MINGYSNINLNVLPSGYDIQEDMKEAVEGFETAYEAKNECLMDLDTIRHTISNASSKYSANVNQLALQAISTNIAEMKKLLFLKRKAEEEFEQCHALFCENPSNVYLANKIQRIVEDLKYLTIKESSLNKARDHADQNIRRLWNAEQNFAAADKAVQDIDMLFSEEQPSHALKRVFETSMDDPDAIGQPIDHEQPPAKRTKR